mmetsp:Transcript_481/g.675  ORF Transcript_481/g.675 Transcript_481/m.675 type:complete len:303 (+) Transcript_481:92-1000(+)
MSKEDDLNIRNIVLKGFLGGIGNGVAVTVTSPLDVLKIRFQTQNQLQQTHTKAYNGILHGIRVVLKNEGVRGLYKGLSVSVFREMTYTSTRIALYEPLLTLSKDNQGLGVKVMGGLVSGAVAAAIFNPTDVLKIRFQADAAGTRYRGIYHALSDIIRTEGFVNGLYKGVTTTVIRSSLLTCGQLSSYHHMKQTLIHSYQFKDNWVTHFVSSFFAGFMASLLSTPVDVARTRIMDEVTSSNSTGKQPVYSRNPFVTMTKIFMKEGLLGLYKGFVPSYTRLGTCTIIALVTFEQLRIFTGIGTL